MKRRVPFALLPVLALTSSLSFAAPPSGLEILAEKADVIVVADVLFATLRNGAYEANLATVRVIKGEGRLVAPVLHARYDPGNSNLGAVPGTSGERGIFFLTQNARGTWIINTVGPPHVGIQGGYLAVVRREVTAPVQAVGSALDEVLTELASSAEAEPGRTERAGALLSVAPPQAAEGIYRRWITRSDDLRFYGLAGLISSGDAASLVSARNQITGADPQEMSLLGAAISSFRKADPQAVAAIGEISRLRISRELHNGTVWALRSIHSRETLPYLYDLLGDPDSLTRALAVRGFSAFVSGMRITQDGADETEALDAVLNPGRRQPLPATGAPFLTKETRFFLHFGPFRDSGEDTKYVAFWRSWFEQNRTRLGL